MHRSLLLLLPATLGGTAMAWTMYHALFIPAELNGRSFLWAIALLGPFVFAAAVALRPRRDLSSAISVAVVPAIFLGLSPAACFLGEFGEGCQYTLVLSPLYLWMVVGVTALVDAASPQSSAQEK
jgi:hypothetical protein